MVGNFKGTSLPVNSTGILILVVLVLALVFSIVSSGVQEEVARMLSISEENTPSESSIQNFLPFLFILGSKLNLKSKILADGIGLGDFL